MKYSTRLLLTAAVAVVMMASGVVMYGFGVAVGIHLWAVGYVFAMIFGLVGTLLAIFESRT